MKRQNLFSVCFASVLFILFFSLNAQTQFSQNRSTISGHVFDTQRRPVSQIPVELMNDVNSVLQRTKTDGSGRFFFGGLSQGRFSVRVLPLGTNLEEQTQDVEISGVGISGRPLSEAVQLDFYLKLRRSGNESPESTGVIFAQEVPEEARKTFERAVSDLNDNRLDLTVTGLENAVKLFPNYYVALERLGIVYISQQKYQNARDVFTRAVAVNARGFNSWYGLSYANYALKQTEDAIEAAQKAVNINSNSVDALLFLGVVLRQAKRYEEAEKSFKQANKFAEGKSSDVHWNLALLYAHNLKRYKDAANELEKYLKLNPNAENSESIKKLIKQFRDNQVSAN